MSSIVYSYRISFNFIELIWIEIIQLFERKRQRIRKCNGCKKILSLRNLKHFTNFTEELLCKTENVKTVVTHKWAAIILSTILTEIFDILVLTGKWPYIEYNNTYETLR